MAINNQGKVRISVFLSLFLVLILQTSLKLSELNQNLKFHPSKDTLKKTKGKLQTERKHIQRTLTIQKQEDKQPIKMDKRKDIQCWWKCKMVHLREYFGSLLES